MCLVTALTGTVHWSLPGQIGTVTRDERLELEHQEDIIDRAEKMFVDKGRALRKIRDERLYQVTHSTFEAYVRSRLEMTRQRACAHERAQAIRDAMDELEAATTGGSPDAV